MQYYAITEHELRAFHLAGINGGGGDTVAPVIAEIKQRKVEYAEPKNSEATCK
jgi:hypothetical protein